MSNEPENFFELFGIPTSYEVDLDAVENGYYILHQHNHPDAAYEGHVPVLNEEQKAAKTHNAAVINDGYTVLRDPLLRALYMLNMHGKDAENLPASEAVLTQSMEDREALASATDLAAITTLSNHTQKTIFELTDGISKAFNEKNIDEAETLTSALNYQAKFSQEIEQKLRKLQHAA